ncbi:MAG: aminodeoxychorismate synthase component I [Candidatus Omnitrophica bacterium]|nr:aminodeoxychorismate synthase component I [Candidatus Omnitrophota bacterium]MCM8807436.1 aminodeoxychorismate synthase component I [Candidatus Omnitrophota bacterium]
MKKINLLPFPYVKPESFLIKICNYPFSFLMNIFWNRHERYTLCGFSPFLIFKSKKRKIEIIDENNRRIEINGDPIEEFQKIFDNFKIKSENFFVPGGIGFLSYDLAWQIENLPQIAVDDLLLPDIFVCFYKSIFVFDEVKKKSFLITVDHKKNKTLTILNEQKKISYGEFCDYNLRTLKSNMTYSYYIRAIEKIKNYIKEGDVYQINFSHRFQIDGNFDPFQLFLRLKKVNPAPYSAYFNCENFFLISNSPELFLKKEKDKIITKPMKGTRKRMLSREEDIKVARELLKSEKDRAELIMIVDLERNDLGKICEYGSVRVKKLINLERYKTVYQTTSIVEGKLKKNIKLKDVLKAMFPGGSITGAPKKRAIEIIEEVEPTKRNFYTGCFGYFGFNGNLQLNILIRTVLLKNKTLYYPVGGGIVWDSIPEKEYEETLIKAKNLFLTIGIKEDEIRETNF